MVRSEMRAEYSVGMVVALVVGAQAMVCAADSAEISA